MLFYVVKIGQARLKIANLALGTKPFPTFDYWQINKTFRTKNNDTTITAKVTTWKYIINYDYEIELWMIILHRQEPRLSLDISTKVDVENGNQS